MALRFKVGDRVQCNTGSWSAGTVAKLNYREANWAPSRVAPYQIKLDDGRYIFAPMDEDRVIRAYDGPYEEPEEEAVIEEKERFL